MTLYSSREPFNDDPFPYQSIQSASIGLDYRVNEASLLSRPEQRQGYAFKPRPEYDRPQNNPTNPLLTDYRIDIAHTTWRDRNPLDWLDEVLSDLVRLNGPPWTPFQVNHSRKVLTRLAALKEES